MKPSPAHLTERFNEGVEAHGRRQSLSRALTIPNGSQRLFWEAGFRAAQKKADDAERAYRQTPQYKAAAAKAAKQNRVFWDNMTQAARALADNRPDLAHEYMNAAQGFTERKKT